MTRVLIIEDEIIAAERLEKTLEEIDSDIQIVAKTGSIKESVQWLLSNIADLIFLDIQLSDGLSFSIFDQVKVNTPIIFTTAYDQYAIKAFKLNSVSYLLKPIKKTELAESLKKYRQNKTYYNVDFSALLAEIREKAPEYRKRFLIQTGDKFRKVEIENIAYFYVSDGHVSLRTFNGHSYPVDSTLDTIENSVDPVQFFRINRQYLISMQSIANMTAWSRSRIKIVLNPAAENEMDTIVSIDRSAEFKNWMNK
ncbi:MAG: DNA-binding response regulator [Bacteroidetes bacterium GWF2_40_14]|nr:MAG: DNA-binding response regulator [Bacteroidetes bacterium GWF2_40_14]